MARERNRAVNVAQGERRSTSRGVGNARHARPLRRARGRGPLSKFRVRWPPRPIRRLGRYPPGADWADGRPSIIRKKLDDPSAYPQNEIAPYLAPAMKVPRRNPQAIYDNIARYWCEIKWNLACPKPSRSGSSQNHGFVLIFNRLWQKSTQLVSCDHPRDAGAGRGM